jgi:DNA primase
MVVSDCVDVDELKCDPNTLWIFLSRLQGHQKQGRRHRASCPFHYDPTPSLDVYPHGNIWLYKCLGCGAAGNVIQFVERFDGISFPDAVRVVRSELGVSPQTKSLRKITPVKPDLRPPSFKTYSLAEYAAAEENLAKNQATQDWLRKERGISYDTAKQLHLGYKQRITSRVPELQDVINQGWIVFPCIEGDRVRLIKFRSIARKAFARVPHMETWLFNAQVIDDSKDLYVTEGECDCICLIQACFQSCSIGSTTTPITQNMIDRMKQARRVILAGDSDECGMAKMREIQAQIPGSLLLQWPCKDANEFFLNECERDVDRFRECVVGLTQEAGTEWK